MRIEIDRKISWFIMSPPLQNYKTLTVLKAYFLSEMIEVNNGA